MKTKYKVILIAIVAIGINTTCQENNMFFKKEIPEIKESWSVNKGEYNSLSIIVRKNDGAKTISGKGFFNYRSGISYAILQKTENGLESPQEMENINKIEDKIFILFNDNKTCIVTTIISTNNFKEYVIYHNGKIDFEKKEKEIQKSFPNYKITSYSGEDKKWEVYNQY